MARLIFALLLLLPAAASAQPRVDTGAGYDGTHVCVYRADGVANFLVGAAWVTVTTDVMNNIGVNGAPYCPADLKIVHLSVKNTHATNSIYIMLGPQGSAAAADGLEIKAGEELGLTGLLKLKDGAGITSVSVIASGASTSLQIVVQGRP
jgi:hypothetical protein